jgi:hypothetical protein
MMALAMLPPPMNAMCAVVVDMKVELQKMMWALKQ